MTDPQPRPPRRIPTANALYDALVAVANELDTIRAVCERAHLVTLDPKLSVQQRWIAAEFPMAIGTVMASAYLQLERLDQTYGITPERNDEQRARRARDLLREFRRELHKEFGGGGDVDAVAPDGEARAVYRAEDVRELLQTISTELASADGLSEETCKRIDRVLDELKVGDE